MADTEYLIEILAKLRDEAGPGIAKLKAEINSLKDTQDAESAEKDLGNAIKGTGDEADKSRRKHEDHRKELEKGKRATDDAGRGARDAARDIDETGRAHDKATDSARGHTKAQEDFVDSLAKVKQESKDTKGSIKDLDDTMESLLERRDELSEKSFLPNDVDGLNKQREAYADLDRQIKSVANSYSRFATARKVGEENLRDDSIRKSEQGFTDAAQARAEADRLQKLVPASRQPLARDTAEELKQIKADEVAADAKRELETRVSRLSVAYDDFNNKTRSGSATESETRKGYKDFANEFSSLSRQFEVGGDDALEWGVKAEQASKKAKNALVESTGGAGGLRAFGRGDIGEGIEAIGSKFDDLGVRITGVSSFLRGFFDLAKIGLSQQLITGVISLAGGLLSVGSAATEAGAALAGAFISGIGQAIPMLAIAAAAVERFKNILQAVSVAGQAEQQYFYDPTEKQVTQLQNVNQLISSQQQLSNSYIQLYEAQQRVRDSQIELTEARYTAQRQITELANAEKDARLEAEGANLSLIESRRQLQIAQQKGDASGLQQAELAVKEAELSKKKADYEIPKAEREARLARQRGVSGAPSVISAVEGLEGSKVAVLQAQQAGEAAQRQEQITKLQEQSRSSKETTYESQLKFLKKGMSPTELGLTAALIEIEKELKSPSSPLKKITDYFVEPFTNAVEKIRSLLKSSSFLGPIDELAESMGKGLGKLEGDTYGAKGTNFFETMAKDASQNVPIVTEAIEHIMHLFEDIAKSADPAFHKLSEDWNNFWGGLDKKDSSAEGLSRLEQFFNKGAEYAEKFGSLGKSIYDLFRAIGSDAAPQGISTVSSFTEAIKSATDWIEGHKSTVVNFFKEAREGLGLIGGTLLQVGKELVGVFNLSSLRALSSFLNEVLLPGFKLVFNIIGKFTTVVIEFFNLLGKPGRDALGIIGAVIATIIGISKIYTPIRTAITLIHGLKDAVIALKAGEGIAGIYNAMAAAFDRTGKSAAAAKTEIEGLTGAEDINVGSAEADTGAQTEVAAGEAGAGGSGLLGGAGLLGKAGLPLAALGGLVLTRSGGQETGASGLLTGNTSEFGGDLERYSGKELGDLEHLQIGKFVSGIFGSSNDESKSENKLRSFGNEVEKLKGHLSELPEAKLLSIQHEAESLAQNPALAKWSSALTNTANQFNPMQRVIKEFSEATRENLEKLSPAAKGVAESFNSISISSGRIWTNIKNALKENLESIRENLGDSSKQGKEALAANFADAQKKIEESMDKGTTSTSIGMARIKKLVSEALDKYGVKPGEVEGDLGNSSSQHKTGTTITQSGQMHASGAYIPATPGGHLATLAEGGYAEAVLSTDPKYAAKSRSILGKYFSAAPHMSTGGFVADPGTNFTVNQEPKIVTELRKLGEYLGTTIYGISGYRSPAHSVEVGGYSDDPHTRGEAADIGVGSNSRDSASRLTASLLSKFDLYRPFYPASAAEINHVQLMPGDIAKIVGSSAGGGLNTVSKKLSNGIEEITAPLIKGGATVGKVSQAALNVATKAANIYLGRSGFSATEASLAGSSLGPGKLGPSNKQEFARYLAQYTGLPEQFLGAWINHEQGSSTVEGGNNWLNVETGGPGGGSGPYGATAQWVERHTPKQAAKIEAEWLKLNLPELLRAKSATEAVSILENSGYAESHYGNQSPQEFLSAFAAGGVVGDQVRRLAVRHLRKKVLKFAQGGRAPWGGAPVPIIAHEGERIMNPAQYHETARLAGTSPGGLDHHLGYDSSPRQSFAAGGMPKISKTTAQEITGGISSALPSILGVNATELGNINSLIKVIKVISEGFKKVGKAPEKEVKGFFENIEKLFESLNEGREYLKAYLGKKATGREYKGIGGGQVSSVGGESRIAEESLVSLREEGTYLSRESNSIKTSQKQLKSDIKGSKSKTAIAMYKNEYNALVKKQKELDELVTTNIEAKYEAETQVLQDKITEANNLYQTVSQEQQTSITGAQSLGKLGEVGGLEEASRKSAEGQLSTLAPLLKQAEKIGNKELESTIKQEMSSLRQTITNAVVENISNAQTLITRESGLAESKTSMLQSLSKVAAQKGNFAEAGSLEKQALENKGQSLSLTRVQEEKLREEAAQKEDIAAVITLNEELDKNSGEIAENNLALKENAVVTRELVLNQIQATGQFRSGVYGAAQSGLEILGKTTGYTNVGGLLSAAKGKEGALGTERSELEGQAGGMGLGVEGMSPAQILSYLASPEGQSKLAQLEKGEDKGEKEQMYKLVDALETNATNTLKNSEEIAKLNGQLNQPQTWSTTAWNQFRGAFFGGMGNLLPQYSSVLPPGSQPTEMPIYGSAAAGASRAAPTIGNLNLTHPVEKLDPGMLGEEMLYHMNDTPSMA